MKKLLKNSALMLIALWVAASCSSTDCPLNNTVAQVCNFYSANTGQKLNVADTISVMVRDSVILNRATAATTLSLPMSYSGEADTLVFCYTPANKSMMPLDTIVVEKTNVAHFISLDCGTSVFHSIKGVKWNRRTPDATYRYAIDTVIVKNKEVTYDEQENLQIYFTVHQ